LGWVWFTKAQTQLAVETVNPQDVMRLHVLANSDSDRDQQIKYKVRDAIVTYLTPQLEQISSPVQARQIISSNQEQLVKLADEVLSKEQAGYQARLQMGEFDFPIRSYGTLLFPAGRYEAVKILLGQGAGQNWWCVLFPPLCFIDGTHAEAVTLTDTAAEAAQSQPEVSQIQFKSKLAEIIEGW
jgi:stage II sporulation protein R